MREYKEIYNYKKYKSAHELQKKTREMSKGAWKDRASDWSTTDPRCYRCATLITTKSITVQTPRSEHAGPGESELPNE